MPKRKTQEEFEKEIFDLVGDEYTFLDPYVNGKSLNRLRHNKCGGIQEKMTAGNFLKGHGKCKECKIKDRFYKKFNESKSNIPSDFEIIEENYMDELIKLKHKDCGDINSYTLNRIINGSIHCYCTSKKAFSDQAFKDIVEYSKLNGKPYEVCSYDDSNYRIKIKCLNCNEHFEKSYSVLYSDKVKCPVCKKNNTIKNNFSKFNEKYNLEYELLDPIDNKFKYYKHNKCGKTFNLSRNGSFKSCLDCKTLEQIFDIVCYINKSTNGDYDIIDYDIDDNLFTLIHNKCGKVYTRDRNTIVAGNGLKCDCKKTG